MIKRVAKPPSGMGRKRKCSTFKDVHGGTSTQQSRAHLTLFKGIYGCSELGYLGLYLIPVGVGGLCVIFLLVHGVEFVCAEVGGSRGKVGLCCGLVAAEDFHANKLIST